VTGSANIPVPDQAARYQLVADAHRTSDDWPLWTTVSSAWTFRSSSADEGKALPLLTARFDPDVNLYNRAPGGKKFSFPAYVERQGGGARITAFTVDVSYNDGQSRQPATVRRDGDHWIVSVQHPQTGYASLRANATDADGNSVQQNVIKAYQIGDPPRR
jgi:hypothetical protein